MDGMFQPQPTPYSPFSTYGVGSPVVAFPGYHSASGAVRVRVPVPESGVGGGIGIGIGIGDVGGGASPASSTSTTGSGRAIFRGPVFSPVNGNANHGNGNGNAIPNGRASTFTQHHPAVRQFKMEGHINDMEEQQRLAAEYEAQLEVRLCHSKMRAFC